MAKIIKPNFDLFVMDGQTSGLDGYLQAGREVRIPHYLGNMIVSNKGSSLRNRYSFELIQHIKFIREWHADTHGANLCLKDAKDIVDHYVRCAERIFEFVV